LRQAPDEYEAYDQVANYMLLIDEPKDAISLGEKALALRERDDQWNAHRTLAIAYMGVGEFDQSIRHARRAQELRNSLIADPPFMYAVAKSYAAIGNITVAKKTLGMLIKEIPSERGSAEFNDAINFLAAQIKKGNVRN
jgi:tetratricopeptide (TPR) repeat protein